MGEVVHGDDYDTVPQINQPNDPQSRGTGIGCVPFRGGLGSHVTLRGSAMRLHVRREMGRGKEMRINLRRVVVSKSLPEGCPRTHGTAGTADCTGVRRTSAVTRRLPFGTAGAVPALPEPRSKSGSQGVRPLSGPPPVDSYLNMPPPRLFFSTQRPGGRNGPPSSSDEPRAGRDSA